MALPPKALLGTRATVAGRGKWKGKEKGEEGWVAAANIESQEGLVKRTLCKFLGDRKLCEGRRLHLCPRGA